MMKKIIILMLFTLVGWQQALAQTFSSGGLIYDVTSPTTVQVGDQQGQATGNVTIPTQVTDGSSTYYVTDIGDAAFADCAGLTWVAIPNSVTGIYIYAFKNCTGLTSINIPDSVDLIANYAFYNCSGLTSLAIGSSVTTIANFAFRYCSSLTSVTCKRTAPISINANVFQNANQSACHLFVPTGSVAAYKAKAVWKLFIPISAGCSATDNFTTISTCGSYTWANDGQTYTTSGVYTGSTTNCVTEKLDLTITAPPTNFSSGGINYVVTSPTTVAVGVNPNASGIVGIPSSVTAACGSYAVTSISNYAFYGCTGLTSVTIPNSVTSIGGFGFGFCPGLTSITIPNSVMWIGDGCFNSCTGLTSVTFPNSVTDIGQYAFTNCSALTSVTIPNSVTLLRIGAFSQCSSLTSVTCNIVSPLSINANVFEGVNQSACSLTVPAGSMAAYQSAAVWQNFMIPSNIPTSKVRASLCGTTLATIDSQIAADILSGSEMYRFEVTNGANVSTFETTKYNFDLTKVAGSTYATTYSIRIAAKMSGAWGAYGAACNITTPSIASANNIPVTKMRASYCGTTLATIGSPIPSELVYGAEAYRFQLTNGATVTEVESPIYYFFLTDTAIGTYGTTFSVKTAAKINGTWGNYGTSCSISTPALTASSVPTTQLLSAFCGTTLAALTTKIGANTVYKAEGYRFEITKGGVVTVYDSALYNFRLSDAGIVATSGTTYAVSVAAKVNGVYGNYGTSCNVTTPGEAPIDLSQIKQATATTSIETIDFSLVAYPNPSNSAFKLQINGSNSETVSVLVFDMTGRQIENKVMNASDIENISIGQNYSTGVYNVIVSQGMNTKTVRLVKN